MSNELSPSLFAPRTAAQRSHVPSLVDVTLDEAQRAAIELPPGRHLLVLGEAGHGKTTVLLHRVARVWRLVRAKRPVRAGVIVPTEGLVRLLQPLLRRLGLDIEVFTFDRFAAKQARRSFRRLPRESDSTPPSVMRLKRSPALRIALSEIAARTPGIVDDDRDAHVSRLRGHVTRGDLQHLFGDRELMERVAKHGALPARIVGDVLERTRVQFSLSTEVEWAHVTDRTRLVAIDGRPIDEGTATGNATTIDVEDYAVLFELDRMRAIRRRSAPTEPRGYDVLALDEAQELAPLELALIGRSLAPGGTLVVAGDADQHTDDTASFCGWDTAMRELGADDHVRTKLDLGFRCPPQVVTLARAVRDGHAPPPWPIHVYPNERALVQSLGEALAVLRDADLGASIGVVCRAPLTARRLAGALRASVPTKLVFDGRFLPRGPVQVTVVGEVKGLELDFVVIPVGRDEWPDDRAMRRALYVAITRARHQVVFVCVDEATPILDSAPRRDRA